MHVRMAFDVSSRLFNSSKIWIYIAWRFQMEKISHLLALCLSKYKLNQVFFRLVTFLTFSIATLTHLPHSCHLNNNTRVRIDSIWLNFVAEDFNCFIFILVFNVFSGIFFSLSLSWRLVVVVVFFLLLPSLLLICLMCSDSLR